MSGEPGGGSHVGPEPLAALLDHALAEEERRRVLDHLATCDECYELFADAARCLAEERAVTPGTPEAGGGQHPRLPGRAVGRTTRWRGASFAGAALAAAAAVVLLVGTPAARFFGLTGRTPSLQELAAPLPAGSVTPALRTLWNHHGWANVRGDQYAVEAGQVRAFQIGVRVVQTEVALGGQDPALIRELVGDLGERLTGLEPLPALYLAEEGMLGKLDRGAPTPELLALNRQADRLLAPNEEEGHPGFVDGFWYQLGKWAGAAQMAAAVGERSFFAERMNRRFLRQAADEDLPPRVTTALGRLDSLISDDPAERLPEIEQAAAQLIAAAGGGEVAKADPRLAP